MSFGSLHPGMDRDEEEPSSADGVGASHSYLLPGSDELDREDKGFYPDSAWGALGRKGVLSELQSSPDGRDFNQ